MYATNATSGSLMPRIVPDGAGRGGAGQGDEVGVVECCLGVSSLGVARCHWDLFVATREASFRSSLCLLLATWCG